MTTDSTPAEETTESVGIPGPRLRAFLTGFVDGEPGDGPGGVKCLPLAFMSGDLTMEFIAPVDTVEQIAREMLKACTRARITDDVDTGIVGPDGTKLL